MEIIMPNASHTLSAGSLAGFVVSTAQHRARMAKQLKDRITGMDAYQESINFYQGIATALPKAKPLSYGRNLVEFVEDTYPLDTRDVLGQLSHANFPFDQMWLVGTIPPTHRFRIGALVTANPEGGAFSFKYLFEMPHDSSRYINRPVAEQLEYIQEGKRLYGQDIEVNVSLDGIVFDEDKLMFIMERLDQSTRAQNLSGDATKFIDQVFAAADFYARLFLVLGSDAAISQQVMAKTNDDLLLEAKNKRRVQIGKAPIFNETPIVIDLSEIHRKLLSASTADDVRKLLGWTSVRRSREIRRKDGTLWISKKTGKPFTRGPHNRQIASPVDRRNVERELVVRDTAVGIEIKEGRPVRVRKPQDPSEKPKR